MEINIRQIKIKNCPDYLFSGNLIVNIKDFDSRVFLLLAFIRLNTSLEKVLIG